MKRFLPVLLTLIMVISVIWPAGVSAETISPEIFAETAVLIDADTGQVLYDKVKDYQEYPASTTKIMTALLVLEKLPLDQTVTISHDAANTEGSRIYLIEGEQVTIEELLYGLMLESANDAAIALAEAVSGNVADFAALMNQRARELGCQNTNFVTPNGLPNDQHVTTAYDLALISQAAMKLDTFRTIVSTYEYNMPATNLKAEVRSMHNTNKLLFDTSSKFTLNGVERTYKYDGILGVKTGHTDAAGYCLVAAAERDGIQLIGVIMKSDVDNQFPDMIQLLDYGFDRYAKSKILGAGDELGTVKVKGGKQRSVGVTVENDVYVTAEKQADGTANTKGYSYNITVHELTAPVEAGTVAGSVTVLNGSKEAGTYDLVITEAVEEGGPFSFLNGMSPISALKMVMVVVFAFLAMYVLFVVRVRRKNRREREKRRRLREQRRRRYDENAADMDLRRSRNMMSEYDVRSNDIMSDYNPQNNIDDIFRRYRSDENDYDDRY